MSEWKMVRLGDVCEIQSGGTPSRSKTEYWKNGTIPWVKIGDFSGKYLNKTTEHITQKGLENSSAKLFSKGTILYSIFATLGEATILNIDATTNQAIAGIKIKDKSSIDIDYLFAYLNSLKEEVNRIGRGVAQNNINLSILKSFTVPLPPLETQKQIAKQLNKCTTLLEKHKQMLEKYDTLIKSRFIEMTENSETELIRMGDIASYINGYAFKPEDWSNTGKKIIRIQNLNDKKASYNHFEGNLDKKFLVRKNDVLISWATHLEAYIWDEEDAWLNQHIFKVVFDKRQINKIYFVYSTEDALKFAFRNAHGFKPTMEHIKRADFENAEVKLPSLAVQEQFAAFVQQIDKSKFAVQKSLEKAETLYKSLMQEYFG